MCSKLACLEVSLVNSECVYALLWRSRLVLSELLLLLTFWLFWAIFDPVGGFAVSFCGHFLGVVSEVSLGSHWHHFGFVLTTSPHRPLPELMWRFLHHFCSIKAGCCPLTLSALRQNGNLGEFCGSTSNALAFPCQIMRVFTKKNQSKTIIDLRHALCCNISFFRTYLWRLKKNHLLARVKKTWKATQWLQDQVAETLGQVT